MRNTEKADMCSSIYDFKYEPKNGLGGTKMTSSDLVHREDKTSYLLTLHEPLNPSKLIENRSIATFPMQDLCLLLR